MKKRIKIIHIEITFKNEMPRVWRECLSAKNENFDVEVYGFGESDTINNIKYIGFGKPTNRINRILSVSKKMIERASQANPDIIHIHSPELLLYRKIVMKKNIKLIFDSHEIYKYQIYEKDYLPFFVRPLVSFLYTKYEKYVCKNISAIIYPCTVNGKNIYSNINKNTIKIENFPQRDVKIAQKKYKKNRNVIYSGQLDYKRGICNMIEASKNEEFNLILCGSFSCEEVKNYVMKAVKENNNIKYLGLLNRDDLYKIYNKCCIGISLLPNIGQYPIIDNLPTKIYEYMQCGMSVVFSNFKYANEINDKTEFGIPVNPENINEIKHAIKYLIANEKMMKRMGDNGKTIVQNYFNWNNESKKLIDFYRKLV